jgi:hypothetical protein
VKIEWATLCERAENSGSGFNIWGASKTIAVAPQLPVQISTSIAISLGGIKGFPAIEQVRLQILAPSGSVIHEVDQDVVLEMTPGQSMPAGATLRHPMIGALAFPATEYGDYKIIVSSGDGSSYETMLTVVSEV